MENIIEMFLTIEKQPQIAIAEKRIDYLFHFLTGRFEREKQVNRSIFCADLAQWIYEWLVSKEYKVKFSFYWYKMIYEISSDEEEAWQLFYKIVGEYFEKVLISNLG